MTDSRSETIAIAGAGIAGLLLAGALIRQGRQVKIFEERPGYGETGAGISLWPNALAALDYLGLGDDVRGLGTAISAGGLRAPDGSFLRSVSPDDFANALGEPLRTVHRVRLIELLAKRVPDDVVQFDVAVTGYRAGRDGVSVELSDGTAFAAAALVGADGYRSAVLRRMQPQTTERYAGYTAWRGLSEMSTDGREAHETLGDRAEFGFIPLVDGRTYWFATLAAPAGGAPGADGDLTWLRRAFVNWHDPITDVLATTSPTDVMRHDIVDRSMPRRLAEGRVVLIGDAAHAMRPHLGQGGCQSVEDACVLARCVEDCIDLPVAFAVYSKTRHRRVRRIVAESAMAGRLLNVPPPLGALVHRGVALTPQRPFLAHLAGVAGADAFRRQLR
ncbi:FAD-binding monooxygenase [Skermania sp. ID1734]|uniref:FAD-dependent monooxygenase n=1 Tax=Skermania sp. ID1734 TaxID=2597516 RepID=UPI00117E34A9|nr:FAD-dependent monooxygenase [Skermania sp. ID1734]TSD99321.1 FAD-binding monooxygenase [Skermania sp. ID1734]